MCVITSYNSVAQSAPQRTELFPAGRRKLYTSSTQSVFTNLFLLSFHTPVWPLSHRSSSMTHGSSPRSTSSPLHRLASKEKPLSALSPLRLYLIAFNLVSFLGWLVVLLLSLHHLLTSPNPISAFDTAVFPALLCVESLALLEVVHSLSGVVRSPFLTTFLQVFQRNFVLFGIAYPVPLAREHVGFVLMTLAWCAIEVVRYPFYAWTLWSPSTLPRWLIWLRYSLFIPLYPLGMAAELACFVRAIPVLIAEDTWTLHLPNRLNFSYDWALYAGFDALLYLPGCPLLFSHMMKQRRAVLQGIDAVEKFKDS